MPSSSLALIVQSAPYRDRVARSDVDIALAAAALDFDIRIYFQGYSVMQLAARRNASKALLPKGYRAWAALPDLAGARIFAEQKWLDLCLAAGLELVLPVESLGAAEMKRSWRTCDHVLVL
jgi:sulfur relay (sulfurtransferase) DsrF/TusC family protein